MALVGAVGFDLGQFGDAGNDVGDVRTENIADLRDGGMRVLHDVMEKARSDGDGIQVHIRQDRRNLERMR